MKSVVICLKFVIVLFERTKNFVQIGYRLSRFVNSIYNFSVFVSAKFFLFFFCFLLTLSSDTRNEMKANNANKNFSLAIFVDKTIPCSITILLFDENNVIIQNERMGEEITVAVDLLPNV